VQADITLGHGQLLTVGADWLRDRGDVASAFASFDKARGNRAAFAQLQSHFGASDVQASLRHDDNDQFGGHDTGAVAWGMDATHGLRFTASAGTAFKAPTLNELYYPFYGNPALLPETSRSVELGLAQRMRAWRWQLSAYDTTIDDLITYDPMLFVANNIDSARIRGAELTLETSLAGWVLAGQATYTDPRNRSATNPDKLLPRRARQSARIDVDRGFDRWRLGVTWIAEGGRYDDVANTLHVGGYATFDLRAEVTLASDWSLQAEVRNAFDRRYETAAYYNQPGREWGLSLRWRPTH
jgi:vitamin B12 transporter